VYGNKFKVFISGLMEQLLKRSGKTHITVSSEQNQVMEELILKYIIFIQKERANQVLAYYELKSFTERRMKSVGSGGSGNSALTNNN
jgi:hypothetical protein